MQYVHSKGVVYRDLKPENILLTLSGHVQLCDFSIAYRLGSGPRSCTFCGTPEYIAPEVLLNKGAGKVRATLSLVPFSISSLWLALLLSAH